MTKKGKSVGLLTTLSCKSFTGAPTVFIALFIVSYKKAIGFW